MNVKLYTITPYSFHLTFIGLKLHHKKKNANNLKAITKTDFASKLSDFTTSESVLKYPINLTSTLEI